MHKLWMGTINNIFAVREDVKKCPLTDTAHQDRGRYFLDNYIHIFFTVYLMKRKKRFGPVTSCKSLLWWFKKVYLTCHIIILFNFELVNFFKIFIQTFSNIFFERAMVTSFCWFVSAVTSLNLTVLSITHGIQKEKKKSSSPCPPLLKEKKPRKILAQFDNIDLFFKRILLFFETPSTLKNDMNQL